MRLQRGDGGGFSPLRTAEEGQTRAPNLAAYNLASDISELAAAYAFGIVRNHAFVDANKRTALAVLGTFLNYNGYELMASDEESCEHMVGVAEGMNDEKELASWVKAHE
jgi:death-on-curing protein